MALKIKFDNTNSVIPPTFVLCTESNRKIGIIPAEDINITDNFNTYAELTFKVNKYDNGNEYAYWDDLENFKIIWCREWDRWFQIQVEIDESNDLVKTISGKSLGESELSQVMLWDIEINTENDILRDDYVPTTLYNENNPEASLLNRIMEKVPNWRVRYVEPRLASMQRTFTFDSTSIYDAFQEIAEELNCFFFISSESNDEGFPDRFISVYDLESYCYNCGYRGNFSSNCPECGSDNVSYGYGDDTAIFVSAENLADEITFTTDVDSVKNCFKLEAGDDLMTATVINCNPNGTGYIWCITDDMKKDMSDELVEKINEYDTLYKYYQNDYVMNLSSTLIAEYNALVDKYRQYDSDIEYIDETVVGYPALMTAYYNTIDFNLYLQSKLMPDAKLSDTSAEEQAALLTEDNLTPVAVTNKNSISLATANSAVLAMAKVIVDARYQVKVDESSLSDSKDWWIGNFVVTNYSDDEDTAVSQTIEVYIDDDYETYLEQMLEKKLKDNNTTDLSITGLFEKDYDEFCEEIKKYCLDSLTIFHDACMDCLDLLIEQGVGCADTWAGESPNLYDDLYLPYYERLCALEDEMKVREDEINIIVGVYDTDGYLLEDGMQTNIISERNAIQAVLDFEEFLGEDLLLEFALYRREDKYSNQNYISDGLNNADLFTMAQLFLEVATKELYCAAEMQHSITATLKNLLTMKEFEAIVENFEVANWIRVKIDNSIYRLRLISYEIDFNDLDNLPIEFSDVKLVSDGMSDVGNILAQAATMATSYSYTARQANKGAKGNSVIDNWFENGLDLTNTKIISAATNQDQVLDENGMLFRKYNAITDNYEDIQMKIVNSTMAITDDAWRTVKTAVGRFYYVDPVTGDLMEAYGVNAEVLVGSLILGESLGIYTADGSMTFDENGLTIDTSTGNAFTIKNGDDVQFYIDSDGNVVLDNGAKLVWGNIDLADLILSSGNIIAVDDDGNTIYDDDGNPMNIYKYIGAEYGYIENLTVEMFDALSANIEDLTVFAENVYTLLGGTGSFGTLESIHLTSENAVIDQAVIEKAVAGTILADLIYADYINTDVINIMSDNGGITIIGNQMQFTNGQIQFYDEDGNLRLQIGQDATGNFTFELYSADGSGVMIDENGIHESAVTDGLIVDRMVADDANISGYKLNIEEICSIINNGTYTIEAGSVTIDGQGLDAWYVEINEAINGLEGMTTEGLIGIVRYYCYWGSDTDAPPEDSEVTPAICGEAVCGLTICGLTEGNLWQIEPISALDGVYRWCKLLGSYQDGHTEWGLPYCLDDGVTREQTQVLQTELTVVQGLIDAKVWETDIESYVDPIYGEINTITENYAYIRIEVDSISEQVGSLVTTEGDHYLELTSQISGITIDLDGIRETVSATEQTLEKYGQDISDLEAEIANMDGIESWIPYFCLWYSGSVKPPDNDGLTDAICGTAVCGTTICGVTGGNFWTTADQTAGDGQYKWVKYLLTYVDGTTSWYGPYCLTDVYTRSQITSTWAQLDVLSDRITAEVGSVQTIVNNNYEYFTGQIASLEMTAQGIEATVSDLTVEIGDQISKIENEIASIDGLKNATPYFCLWYSATVTPPDDEDLTAAICGTAICGTTVCGVTTGGFWTTKEPTAGDGQFKWIKYWLEFEDGSTAWSTAYCLTDQYSRTQIEGCYSRIEQLADSISLEVESINNAIASLQLGIYQTQTDIISYINASADVIILTGNRFIVESDNFKLTQTGMVTLNFGTFGNYTVRGDEIVNGTYSISEYDNTPGIYIGTDGIRGVDSVYPERSYTITPSEIDLENTEYDQKTEIQPAGVEFIEGKYTLSIGPNSIMWFENGTAVSSITNGSITTTDSLVVGSYGESETLRLRVTTDFGSISLSVYDGVHGQGSSGIRSMGLYNWTKSSFLCQYFIDSEENAFGVSSIPTLLRGNGITASTHIISSSYLKIDTSYGACSLYSNSSYYGLYDSDAGHFFAMKGASGTTYFGNAYSTTVLYGDGVYLNGTSTAVTSDRSLKNDISPLSTKYDDLVEHLTPRAYTMKEGGDEKHIGFVVDEVEAAMKEAGMDPDDYGLTDYFTDESGEKIGAIRYEELIPMLVHEIQTLRERVAALEN